MKSSRMEFFSDGFIAIIITIMVLELKPPQTDGWDGFLELLPGIGAYGLSFAIIGIYWLNHHQLVQLVKRVNGKMLWANLLWLFFMSFYPLCIRWTQETDFGYTSTVVYVVLSIIVSIAFYLLSYLILHGEGCLPSEKFISATKKKDIITLVFENLALVTALIGIKYIPYVLILCMALLWIIPDLKILRFLSSLEDDDFN